MARWVPEETAGVVVDGNLVPCPAAARNDIGLTCLEFAVIGSTVNAASRLEGLTRALDCQLVASDDLVKRAKAELASADAPFRSLTARAPQTIRGLEHPIAIWTQVRTNVLA